MIADCNERQEARREVTTARALMKPTETNLIGDLVGALLSVFFLCGARCTCTCTELLPVSVPATCTSSSYRTTVVQAQ